ncbi:MAG: hypothetical protein JST22_13675 [Bacteroidetes bacterium]|nr:hypothetical protein [Bacteroidota bacterium]
MSNEDGNWSEIYWSTGGAPHAGDTVVIATQVVGMPELRYSTLTIRLGASLTIQGTRPAVSELRNDGLLNIDQAGELRVEGNVTNTGSMAGAGSVVVAHDGAALSGAGVYGHISIASAPGTYAQLWNAVTVASLSLGTNVRLLDNGFDLHVDGAYSSASAFGEPGIVANGGTIYLNGSVYGSAAGSVVFGSVPGVRRSRYAGLPEVHGLIGDSAGTVRFAASRRLLFSTIIGSVTVDSGATLEGGGIGPAGANTVRGSLTINGILRTADDANQWLVEGDLFNNGTIESGTLELGALHARLRTDQGAWDPSIRLRYSGPSHGELRLASPLVVSTLEIVPATPLDSDVAVVAGPYPVRVRHSFTSDVERGCRIVTDTTVSLWGAAQGMVDGNTLFEGFWGSVVGGHYGGTGHVVRFVTQKVIGDGFEAVGTLSTDPASHLTVAAPATAFGPVLLHGNTTMQDAGTLLFNGNASVDRTIDGAGTLYCLSSFGTLDVSGTLGAGVDVQIGLDSTASHTMLSRTLHAATLSVHPGSTISYHAGDSLDVRTELNYGVRYAGGFNVVSAPLLPSDARSAVVYPLADSILRYDTGYVVSDSIVAGAGYFVQFPGAATVTYSGRPFNVPATIPVKAGWNLVGGATVPVAASRITVAGTTLLSGFVGSIGGANPVTTLQPGVGYWVNVSADGSITLNPDP